MLSQITSNRRYEWVGGVLSEHVDVISWPFDNLKYAQMTVLKYNCEFNHRILTYTEDQLYCFLRKRYSSSIRHSASALNRSIHPPENIDDYRLSTIDRLSTIARSTIDFNYI